MIPARSVRARIAARFSGAQFERLVAGAVVVAATVYTVWMGRPDAALVPGAPPRSDLGGHLAVLEHLIRVSLPSGHLLDWSHQWFGGYPTFYFYFPLPALIIAALVPVVPLSVAGKIIAVVAPAWLPPATFFFVRAAGFGRLHAATATIASVAFLSLTSQYIFGGNVLSSVIGEYSFALGFALSLFYLALVLRALRGERHGVGLTVLLAATALTHTIPTLFAVLVSCLALGRRNARTQVLVSWFAGFGLTAFWSVPFLLRSPYMGHIAWLYDPDLLALFPLPVLIVLPWTVAACFVLRPHAARLVPLLALAALALLAYLLPHGLFAQGRSLPVWHYVLYLWTGLGVATGLEKAWQRQHKPTLTAWAAGLFMLVGVSAIQVDIVRGRSGELLTTAAPDRAEYDALRARIAQLPPGRLHWEFVSAEGEELLGGRLPLARLAAETPLRTSQGLLVESGLTAAAYTYLLANVSWDSLGARYWKLIARNDADDARMLARLRQLGIDYFVTFSERGRAWAGSAPARFERVAADSAWTIWRVSGSALVEPLRVPPRVVDQLALRPEIANWLETVTDSTPWTVLSATADSGLARRWTGGRADVSARLGHRTVRFTTNAVGSPHIVRVSYFPNWRAYGATGPFLAVPGFMVVVPTERDVLLSFESTWVERAGGLLTLATLLAFLIWVLARPRHSRRPRPLPADAASAATEPGRDTAAPAAAP